jgi:hypothetical protein
MYGIKMFDFSNTMKTYMSVFSLTDKFFALPTKQECFL